MKKMKAAVVGYGGMGGWHTEHLLKSDVCELAGVYDIKPERNALAESRGIYAYPTYQALLDDKSVELITVAIPNDDHEGVVVAAGCYIQAQADQKAELDEHIDLIIGNNKL